jgi:hypothetical protein
MIVLVLAMVVIYNKKKSGFGAPTTLASVGINKATWTLTNTQQINCTATVGVTNTVILTDDPSYGTAYMINTPRVISDHDVWTNVADPNNTIEYSDTYPLGDNKEYLMPYICTTDIGVVTKSNLDYNYLIPWNYGGNVYIGMSNFTNGVPNVVWQQIIGPVSTTQTVTYGFNLLEGLQTNSPCNGVYTVNLIWWPGYYNLFYYTNNNSNITSIIKDRLTPGGNYSKNHINNYLSTNYCRR